MSDSRPFPDDFAADRQLELRPIGIVGPERYSLCKARIVLEGGPIHLNLG